MNLLDLPNIVLIQVFEHLPYEEVSKKRLVCGKIDRICQHILNGGFNKVVRQHGVIFKRIKALLPRRESERRNHCMARHVDILTSIETRLSMLSMTYTKYIDLDLCCFIPGRVLDEILRILRLISNTVKPLRPHEVLQELRDISSMAIEHFDEKIAGTLKRSYHIYNNGPKMCNSTETSKSKISTFFSDYLDNKTNMLLLKSSGSHSSDTLPNLNESTDHANLYQTSSQTAPSDISKTERTEALAVTKKLQLQARALSPNTLPYKMVDVNGNCRLIHLMRNEKGENLDEHAQTSTKAVLDSSNLNSSLEQHQHQDQHQHRCQEARATMTYFKKLELEYKKGIVKMQRMQQIQTQQSRRLQQALSSVAELNVQVVELRKRLEDVDAKNREITENMKQINTGDAVATVAESVSSSPNVSETNPVPALNKSGNNTDKSGIVLKKTENDEHTNLTHSKRSHEDRTIDGTKVSKELSTTDDSKMMIPSGSKKIKY